MTRGLGLWLRRAAGMAMLLLSDLSVAGEGPIAFTGDARAAVAIQQRDRADGTTET